MLSEIIIIVVRGIAIGSIFAMIAMSFNIVHGATGILNFAQGNMLVLGGYAAFFLANNVGIGWWLAMLVVTGVLVAVVLAFQGWITLLPLRSSVEQDSWIISTVAVSVIVGAILLITQGPFAYSVQAVVPPFRILGVRTPGAYGLAIVCMLFWFFAMRIFLRKSFLGLAISALSQDFDAARAAGLPVRRLQLVAFAISGLMIGTAGFLVAPVISVSSDAGLRYVLNGFVAAVVGGIGSNLGTLIGGPLVGVITMLTAYRIGGAYQDLASLAVLVAILMVRPQGLFGRTSARRV
ncbi:branched-chain amino acid ABC transporter permease [Oricola sp.]|uniref:branched-chain amino acid ABC transporter permease n=1 Tax=Oricola sp. TaxID=1979950 RepID=UPI0025F0ADB1|nr:branched-chain amino acid ABC transporter permease [Oricola sp.]MCI5074445.1 branched-chain amino acid ABC transporter permease [Oricola sp.]